MTDEPVPLAFIDNPHAPEVFASAFSGLCSVGGNVAITLESIRVDHSTSPGPVNRVVIGRAIMPPNAAHDLAVALFDYLKRNGYVDPSAVGGAVN
ncbi:MAG: hypothetical protein Q8L66_04840 [Caulobacter sp.]|nr:hypothetical protein [Caulobacter sp.]